MSFIQGLIDFILHIDEHLVDIIQQFGGFAYGIIFSIIFVETGVVIMPFLPGDSLLFASGTLAALGAFSLPVLLVGFIVAAILGDTLNYSIGNKVGLAIKPNTLIGRFIKEEKMHAAQAFFNKHGGKTIVIARFMPFIRTFIPFVAGASQMNYRYFLIYNIIGAVLWVMICTLAGYFFGNIPIIKENFSVVILLIIFISVLPALFGFLSTRRRK